MIRRILALLGIAVGVGGVLDRLLARGIAGGQRPSARPIRSLAVVDAPIETVWAAISDIPAQPRWMHDMKAVHLTTDGPVGAGSRGVADVRIFGIGVHDPVEITTWEPPTRFAIRHEGLFTGDGVIALTSGADGTTTIVRWDEVIVPPAFPELGALIARPILGRIFQDDLGRLCEAIETGTWSFGPAGS